MGEKIIFLDVDGVLNSIDFEKFYHHIPLDALALFQEDYGECFDPAALRILKQLVRETGAKVVLSSSWRTCPEDREIVRSVLAHYLIHLDSDTPICPGKSRGYEIEQWLEQAKKGQRHIESFVILDDEKDMSKQMQKHLVKTNLKHGFQARHAELAREILSRPLEEDQTEEGSASE